MTQNILQEFDNATDTFLQLLASFNQEQINTVPYEGGWTAAQVGEHIFKSDSFILGSLNGPVKPTERPPDENVASLRATFLDFSTKLQAPEIIVPAQCTHDKEALISALKAGREQVGRVITGADLNATCFNPILGEPTRLELINFVIVHTQRHIQQLKKIAEKVEIALS